MKSGLTTSVYSIQKTTGNVKFNLKNEKLTTIVLMLLNERIILHSANTGLKSIKANAIFDLIEYNSISAPSFMSRGGIRKISMLEVT